MIKTLCRRGSDMDARFLLVLLLEPGA
jgi:hypothetical protein